VYLIIIFVGLVVVIILGIMLSAWCCRGKHRTNVPYSGVSSIIIIQAHLKTLFAALATYALAVAVSVRF
jgi:hypothetical protein